MTGETLFYIIIGILVVSYLVDLFMDRLNAKHFDDPIPKPLADVYDAEAYTKSQAYKKEKARFGNYTSLFSLTITLAFFFFDGFAIVDDLARSFSSHPIIIALLFFGIIMLVIVAAVVIYFNFFTIPNIVI